jgi:hypothetical protein
MNPDTERDNPRQHDMNGPSRDDPVKQANTSEDLEEQTATDTSSQVLPDEPLLGSSCAGIAAETTPKTRSTIRSFLAWGYSWLEWFKKRLHEECTACTVVMSPALLSCCPCGHRYCGGCITQLALSSLADEPLFPPRCCREPIPTEVIETHLTADQIVEFRKRLVEYNTTDRTYCHVPTCSAFIPPDHIFGSEGLCPRCFNWTCVLCKGKDHLGGCPGDSATEHVLRLTEEQGWKRCYNCHRVIELTIGCNHMSKDRLTSLDISPSPFQDTPLTHAGEFIACTCGAEFCYECGDQWKTCICPEWDEDRLVERAEVVAGRGRPRRHPNRGEAGAVVRGVSVEGARHNIV